MNLQKMTRMSTSMSHHSQILSRQSPWMHLQLTVSIPLPFRFFLGITHDPLSHPCRYRLAAAAPVSSPVAPTWGAGGMLRVSRKSEATSAHNIHSSNNSNSNASSGHHGNTNNNSSNSTSNSTSNSRRNSHTYAVGGGTAQTSPTEGMSYLPHPTAAIGSTRNHAWEVKVHLPNDYDNHAFNTAARGRAHAHASDALSNFAVAVSSGRNTGTSSSASVGGGNAGDSGLHGTGDQNSDSPGLGVMAFP